MLKGVFVQADAKFKGLEGASFKYDCERKKLSSSECKITQEVKIMFERHFELEKTLLSVNLDKEGSCLTILLQEQMQIEFSDTVVYYRVTELNDHNLTIKWQNQHKEDNSEAY